MVTAVECRFLLDKLNNGTENARVIPLHMTTSERSSDQKHMALLISRADSELDLKNRAHGRPKSKASFFRRSRNAAKE